MTEQQVLGIIERQFRAMRLPLPWGFRDPKRDREGADVRERDAVLAWTRVARAIAIECEADCRRAARAASQVGFAVTRGRTRL